ncbi:MAG TPA: hypothetical protein VKT78_02100 [Fimbriimonadaceae bacterium]|nr:hypothetical protein [Fimbriimonadaceae bacterium]
MRELMIGGAIMLLVCAVVACGVGGLLMLSEGPHGPHGEITWAPGQGRTIALFISTGIVAAIAGIALMLWGARRD